MTFQTSREIIERTIQAIESQGSEGLAIAANLSRPEQAGAAVDLVVNRFGRLDALVSMVSVYRRTPLAELCPSDFDDMIAANLAAPYHSSSWLRPGRCSRSRPPI